MLRWYESKQSTKFVWVNVRDVPNRSNFNRFGTYAFYIIKEKEEENDWNFND